MYIHRFRSFTAPYTYSCNRDNANISFPAMRYAPHPCPCDDIPMPLHHLTISQSRRSYVVVPTNPRHPSSLPPNELYITHSPTLFNRSPSPIQLSSKNPFNCSISISGIPPFPSKPEEQIPQPIHAIRGIFPTTRLAKRKPFDLEESSQRNPTLISISTLAYVKHVPFPR